MPSSTRPGSVADGAGAGGNTAGGAASNGAAGEDAAAGGNTPAGGAAHGDPKAPIGAAGGPDGAYTLLGRFDASVPTAIRMSFANSRIGATFTGTSLAVALADDAVDVYSVLVDAGPAVLVTTQPSATPVTYPVAQNLAPGSHTVWLTKRTESFEHSQVDGNVRTGTGTFAGFVLAPDGSLAAPPAVKAHLVVAVGDSSFTGYGAGRLQTSASPCVFTPESQDAEASVPNQLAILLGAELINISASGKGVAQSAYDPNDTSNQLPALWRKQVPPSAAPAYLFPPLGVDVIVISAGSDDLLGAYGVGTISDPSRFVATYAALLADMRQHYPEALLVAIVNPNAIGSDKAQLTALLNQAVALRNAAPDANVFVYDYFAGDANGWVSYNDADRALGLGHGCQGHASAAGSLFLAQRLASFVRLHLAL